MPDEPESFRMSKLIYITNTSLDGYIEDESGAFDWGNADQVHPLVVELLRPVGTFLYGRRLYETMAYWDTPVQDYPPEYRDFAQVWQERDKIVFSRTLTQAATRKTRVEREFDLAGVRRLKQESKLDLCIGGAEIAAVALRAGLVDECHVLLHPVFLGAGKPAFSADLRLNLELLAARRVGTKVTHVHYRIRADDDTSSR